MPRRPRHLGLHHVALHVRAFEATRSFYVDLLGFRVEWEPDGDNVYLTSGADNLALHRAPSGTSARETALDHVGILVREPRDVDAWAAYLRAQGIALRGEPRTHRDGARSFYVDDPDGNCVQIIHHPPIAVAAAALATSPE